MKKLTLTFLLICTCFAYSSAIAPVFDKDKFVFILKIKDRDTIERKIIYYVKDYFQNGQANQLSAGKALCYSLLDQYNPDNKDSYKYFVESMYQSRLNNQDGAENAIVKAIKSVNNYNAHFLLYIFLSDLGVVQTDKGNSTGAIFSYQKAKKEVEKIDDPHLEAAININISDLYYKNNIYSQSLYYLDNADSIIMQHHLSERHLLTLIYYNKAENFFRMNNLDSLKVYNVKLQAPTNVSSRLFNYRKRTDYYIQLLNHNYKYAIQLILAMEADKQYKSSELDKQRLADAYFFDGQMDSAKKVINELLTGPLEANNPEIKFDLYQKLAAIAEKNNDSKQAIIDYKLTLNEAENYLTKYAQLGNASSQLKINEIESSYLQRDEKYKQRQLIMIFILIVAALSIILILTFYRSIKQKRHYENLLHKAEKNELAIINSHDVRRYLCNILGIIEIVKQSDKPEDAFFETEEYLYQSAEQLDGAINSIAEKLND